MSVATFVAVPMPLPWFRDTLEALRAKIGVQFKSARRLSISSSASPTAYRRQNLRVSRLRIENASRIQRGRKTTKGLACKPKPARPSQLGAFKGFCSSLANFPAPMSTFELVLRVLTTATAILVSVAPLPDFWRIHKNRSTGEVSILPVVLLFANCYMWVLYAYLVNNIFPLFAVTLFGIATSIAFVCIYYRWTKDRLYVVKVCSIALFLLAIGTLYYALATNGVTSQSDAAVEKTLGFIAIAFNLVLYASPLETMKKVVGTKNASSMPISISSVFLLNAVLWVVFALVVDDMFVLVPNAVGAVLCVIQVALYIVYRPGRTGAPAQNGRDEIVIPVGKSLDYEALSSPVAVVVPK